MSTGAVQPIIIDEVELNVNLTILVGRPGAYAACSATAVVLALGPT